MTNVVQIKRIRDIVKDLAAEKGLAVPTDVFDKEGNFKKIDFHNSSGNFILEALWDDRDDQTEENRIAFRKWAYHMMKNKGYAIEL